LFRIREIYPLLKIFLFPALKNQNAQMLDFTERFTNHQVDNELVKNMVIPSLIKTRNQFLQELEHRDQSKETKERIFVTK
jgi:hypothetical protein